MAKDPCCLFYWNDWHGGTIGMTHQEKGCFMDLLHAQFNMGRMTFNQMKLIVGPDFDEAWPSIKDKFKTEDGKYYNERLEIEKERRQKFTKSRQNNLASTKPSESVDSNTPSSHMDTHIKNHMDSHMEIEIEKEIVSKKNEKVIEIQNPKKSEIKSDAVKVLEHLNLAAEKQFEVNSRHHHELIIPRLKEFGLQDCIDVIDCMAYQWKGTDMDQYLRPSTLFRATNFVKYRDMVRHTKQTGKAPTVNGKQKTKEQIFREAMDSRNKFSVI
jgi:uncharacterized phage protein (TIGR02220 family)